MEPETEKKTSTTAIQMTRKSVASSRGASARTNGSSHGPSPAKRMGRKNQNGSTRWCISVVKRWKCSWMKKKRRNSGLAAETAMNHGDAMARKRRGPATGRRRLISPQSLFTRRKKKIAAPGSTRPISPLLSMAAAHAAQNQSMRPSRNATSAAARKTLTLISSVFTWPSST